MPRLPDSDQMGIAYADRIPVHTTGLSRLLNACAHTQTKFVCRGFTLDSDPSEALTNAFAMRLPTEAVFSSELEFLQLVAQARLDVALVWLVANPDITTQQLLAQYIRREITAKIARNQRDRWHGMRIIDTTGKAYLDGDDALPVAEALLARHVSRVPVRTGVATPPSLPLVSRAPAFS